MKKVLIVGGGIGGLTAGALLQKQGYEVTVLEASNEWGGCAGKFSRKEFLFPAGATLGMGFEEGGIHRRIFQELDINFQEAKLLHHIMDIVTPERTIKYVKDKEAFLQELSSHFEDEALQIRSFFQEVWRIGNEVKKLIAPLPALPPASLSDWNRLFRSLKPGTVRLLPYLPMTLFDLLRKHNLHQHSSFVQLLNAVVIDSMQTTTRECSAVMGAYALSIYHEGAFYLRGGLYEAAHALHASIADHGGHTRRNTRITSIVKEGRSYKATDAKGNSWGADHIVCNMPLANFVALLSPHLKKKLSSAYRKKQAESQWGAVTLYLAVEEALIPDHFPLFQILLGEVSDSMAEGSHIFVSTSEAGDNKRAPAGYRTLTVSTHTDLKRWSTKEEYDKNKEAVTAKMMALLETALPGVEKNLIMKITGAPRAWERFTGRKGGMVGGYPQNHQHALFKSLSHRTGIPGIWLCGDSVFPGAGTIGVSVSGYHVYRSISNQ
ncbi:FAD-dependent oxidoreductase [Bacillus lacus]|uniref:FAD-dependent oxidoreductase n=1 Tax=Metabacillus lacus TaxID=1983721 RepID=A0A7X2J0U1_9BACI|nr:FAD-dependent oxidoreductase [Metabacillus lacus]MRX73367.1 FAD-dependent oxidoreductase [Metabacillus lacus]